MKPPDRIRLRLLGGFELDRDDGIASPVRLSTRKACALVAFLAMNRKQAATREELATLLWGSCSDQQARQSLRQALASIRKDLRSPHVLSADNEVVRLQPGIWSVDALDFETLADSPKLEDLERAVELFGGEFLAGFSIEEEGFDEWLQAQRNRIRSAAGRVLATYAEQSGAAGNGQQAIAAAERLLALDPLREDWQRLAMRLYARHRGQHDALAQAKTFEALLRRELDVEPESETTTLIEEIRRGDIAHLAPPADGDLPESGASGAEAPSPMGVEANGGFGSLAPPGHRSPFGRWPGRRFVSALAIMVLVLAGGLFGLTHSRSVPVRIGGAMDEKSTDVPTTLRDPWQSPRLSSRLIGITPIAVLPLTTYSETVGPTRLIADMMTDDLINTLSRASGLRVISRQTALSYQGRPIDIAAIGAELGVRYVLEGNMRMGDDKLRVNVALIDPASRLPVWSSHIERDGAERHAVQDEIVRRIGRELLLEVDQAEAETGSKEPGVDELVHRGWVAIFAAGTSGLDGLKQAEAYFTQALERDPQNERAQTGLASYHVNLSVQGYVANTVPDLAKAEDLVRQVIDRHPNAGDAHYYMAVIHRMRGNLEDAIGSLERSLDSNPSNASAHAQLGFVLSLMGREAEGLEYINYAMRLSPRDPILTYWLNFAGRAELELRHDGRAIGYFRRGIALNPRHTGTLASLAAAHALSGNVSEARTYLSELQKAAPQLSPEQLMERFGGAKGSRQSRMKEGLRLAFAGLM